MIFKLSNLISNLAVTLGYFNPALTQKYFRYSRLCEIQFTRVRTNFLSDEFFYLCNLFTRNRANSAGPV